MSTVMVADDNRAFREGLSELFTELGYEVCEAEDAKHLEAKVVRKVMENTE